jgi:hypothetical protein
MTRKDYVVIAAALRRSLERSPLADSTGVIDAALAMADALAGTNPRFDRSRFLKACGVWE